MPTSREIAHRHRPIPIETLAARTGLTADEVEPYGRHKGKISLSVLDRLRDEPDGKLVCVTSITPSNEGEGARTTLVGLVQALAAAGHRAVGCLRQPFPGATLGVSCRAIGGGYAQVVPTDDLDGHFTGDMHAVGAATNLLAAMLDASILHGNPHRIDALRVPWRRAIGINDAALRRVLVGQGGRANGYPRETGFVLTASSEVMGVLSIARSLQDLRRRLGEIVAAYSFDHAPVTAEALGAAGGMTVLLKDALKPNLVQTLEGQPLLIHGGSFATLGHGSPSLIAELTASKLGDYVLAESGFGADIGLERFLHIICRVGGLTLSGVVLVATLRTLKHHGGLAAECSAGLPESQALTHGIANLRRHIEIVSRFGIAPVVAINQRPGDTTEETETVKRLAIKAGAVAVETSDAFARGGGGALRLAQATVDACERSAGVRHLYPEAASIEDKIRAVARQVYGAGDVRFEPEAEHKAVQLNRDGYHRLPIAIVKTPLSLSADPSQRNAPRDFVLPVRDIGLWAGAGWLVPVCGEITDMFG